MTLSLPFPTRIVLAWSFGLLLAACQTPAPEPEPEPPPEPEPVAPAIDTARLYELLDQADAAIARDHLAYPEEDSALAIYRQILQLDDDQQDARRGLERIVERYVEMAMSALQRGQYARARSMLARARIILPNHPSIEPTDAQIRLLSEATRKKLTLNQDQLNARTPGLQQELQALATFPSEQNCRFYIAARNDAQGRWIYQTMSSAVTDGRLRAQIDIRSPSQVERVCFPDSR